jgi:PAS domain S-box-containing protein
VENSVNHISFDQQQTLIESRERAIYGGYAMAAFFVPLFLLQLVAVLTVDTSDIFEPRAVLLSLGLDIFLIIAMAVFILSNLRAKRLGGRAILFHYPSVLVFLSIFAGAALVHMYLLGTLGSMQIILMVAINFSLLWYVNLRHSYYFIAVCNFSIFGLLFLEYVGIFPHAPLLKIGDQLSATFLDPRMIAMNGTVYLVISTLVVMVVVNLRRAIEGNQIRRGEQAHAILQTAIDGFWLTDGEGRLLKVNESYCQMSGYTEVELLNMSISDLETTESARETANHIKKIPESGKDRFESRHRRKDGSIVDVETNVMYRPDTPNDSGYFVYFLRDITEQRKAKEEKKKLEDQLRQSQKMEAIGRLAGGIAHDFNNLLTGILGYSEMIKSSLDPKDPMASDVEEISKAGLIAAGLTQQLLAFSRKQLISPKVVNLNDIVEPSRKMLARLIGEDIHLDFKGAKDLWNTKVDTIQIEQVLVNLAVNSRDAMPDGGRLTIETKNIGIDEQVAKFHVGTNPCQYVLVTISDSGVGIDKETQARIFEPFFTTKEQGKGTGLGLSTVYGILKQHDGFIFVSSEPGKGTSFKIYLPRVNDEPDQTLEESAPIPVAGKETILLVEDQEIVRRFAKRILEQKGYRVLEAEDGVDALRKCDGYEEEIHLLVTDVVMPNMDGKELFKRISKIRPRTKVLFMSGYTDDVIADHGLLKLGLKLLHKPFNANELLLRTQETLDAGRGSQSESGKSAG